MQLGLASTAQAMTTLGVISTVQGSSLESPVPSTGHAGFGGGREETYWSSGTRLAPILRHTETQAIVPRERGGRCVNPHEKCSGRMDSARREARGRSGAIDCANSPRSRGQ
jgi:hypothetical protein